MSSRNSESPFSLMIIFDYYDGAKAGLITSDQLEEHYRFEFLDWDDGQDVRIFSLAHLPENIFKEIFKLLSETEEPKYPFWMPAPLDAEADAKLDTLLEQADEPEIAIASTDLLENIIAFRSVTSQELQAVTNWFEFLNLPDTVVYS
jgi:hypothetical protein